MEHIMQRQLLRRPLVHDYGLIWDLRDLDGGCAAWRRNQEKTQKHSIVGDRAHQNQIEQFALTVEKKAMAADMWQRRINDNADREGWWLEIHGDNKSGTTNVEDVLDDENNTAVMDDPLEKKAWRARSNETDGEEDNDDNETIYSRALLDPPASHEVFSDASLSSSTLSVDSYVTAPCTLESMVSLAYVSFDSADHVEEAVAAGEIAAPTQPAPDTSTAYGASEEQLAFRETLTQHVRAAWQTYEIERRIETLEKSRTLGWKEPHKHLLSSCDWKWIPLYCSLAEHKEYALDLTTGRCLYERTPTIVVTNEDGEHFRLLEVRKILSEEEIAEICESRDKAQDAGRKKIHKYHIYNMAARQGQTPAERLATDRAKGWWAAEQKRRDVTYVNWEQDEANELRLLQRQIEREVDQYFEAQALSEAKKIHQGYLKAAKAAQTEALANLKLKLAEDALLSQGAGLYTSAAYSVYFTPDALNTFLTHRDDIEAMAFAIQSNAESTKESEAQKKLDHLHKSQWLGGLGLLGVRKRREAEIKRRYSHRRREDWKIDGGGEWDELVRDWLADC